MKSLTRLSARELEYYIDLRRWKTELDFLDLEVEFIKLLEDNIEILGLNPVMLRKASIVKKLAELSMDKEQVIDLLNVQLGDLELLAEGMHAEQQGQLGANQAQLEYQFNDLIHQFRDIKGYFYQQVRQVIASRKQLVN